MTLNRIVGIGLGCLLFAGVALAQNTGGSGAAKPADPKEKAVITNPEWEVPPNMQNVRFFYPAEAAARRLKGDVTLRCKVALTHLVRDCEVVSETPPDAGFGRAAVAFSSTFRMKPMTRNGVPVDGAAVHVPIHFDCGPCSVADIGRFGGVVPETVFFSLPWSRTPSIEEWSAAYPAAARKAPVLGSVAMQCEFASEGRLGSCEIRSEQPERKGFGAAARALAKTFVGPATSAGKSTRGSFVRLNIAFPPELATGARPALPATKLLIAPTDQQIAAVFPFGARERGIPFGKATIQCARDSAGRAGGCTVVSENPAGAGFGQAAMTLAPVMLFSNWSEDGRMTQTSVRVPFEFGKAPEVQESAATLQQRSELENVLREMEKSGKLGAPKAK